MMSIFNVVYASELNNAAFALAPTTSTKMYTYGSNGYMFFEYEYPTYLYGYLDGSSYRIKLASTNSQSVGFYSGSNPNATTTLGTLNVTTYSSDNNLYYSSNQLEYLSESQFNEGTLIPFYDTESEALSSLRNYIDNPVSDILYNYTMQNGWLSVIDLGSSGAGYYLTLSTTFAEYSALTSPYWNSTQRYWFTDTMPSEGDSFNNSMGTVIDWDKTGNTDLFGRSKNAACTLSGTSTGRYLVIYNPAYHKVTSWLKGSATIAVENNLSITIDGITEGTVVKLFKMNSDESILSGSITSTFTSNGATATASGSAINMTDSFTDSDGNTVIQNSGGSNDLHESGGIVGYIVQLSDMLDNFTNSILQLLTAPISHIQQLLNSSSTFFESISGLWSWMPNEISGFIISAFVIMVAISIFKLFL